MMKTFRMFLCCFLVSALSVPFDLCGQTPAENTGNKGWYVGAESGYGFAGFGLHPHWNVPAFTQQSSSGSLAKGIAPGLCGGYMFTQALGVELKLGYLIRSAYDYTYFQSSPYRGGYMNCPGSVRYKASLLRIAPAIRFQVNQGKFHLYSRIGPVIGFPIRVQYDNMSSDTSGTVTSFSWLFKGGLSFGFFGSLGLARDLKPGWSVFAELTAFIQSWAPKKLLLQSYSVNGNTSTAPNSNEIDFVSSYSVNAQSPSYGVSNNTVQMSKVFLPFSSLGLTIGIHYALASKK
jgi:hypothetical protein